MICGRLTLQQRVRKFPSGAAGCCGKTRRLCESRLVDPNYMRDHRWTIAERYNSNIDEEDECFPERTDLDNAEAEKDLYLSVQTLKFEGKELEINQSKANYKYKCPNNAQTHRMFIKEAVEEDSDDEETCSSRQTSYFTNEYAKYITNTASKPSSCKSSLYRNNETKINVNKAVQVGTMIEKPLDKDVDNNEENNDSIIKLQDMSMKNPSDDNFQDAKILYQHIGKRKSLTISRSTTPETVQVIRVDLVSNWDKANDSSINNLHMLDYETEKRDEKASMTNMNNSRFMKKYLLTKSTKTFDQNLVGAKVTLMCKTYKLCDRKLSQH